MEDQAIKSLSQIASRQIPFIAAKSLTNVAQKSQAEVKKHIRDEFHIRKKSGGFESSIRIKPANKKNLTSQVYTMAAFASLQQTGGKKKARDGRLAIPVYGNIKDVKRRATKNSPSAYLAGDAFKMRTKSGKEVIAQRKRGGLKILYFLRKEADIEKRFDMVEVTTKAVNDSFGMIFRRNLQDVLSK
ncbi:hypothetical protein N9C35_04165 [Flavobacteriaceae bacterium]|nr:hypothetical protein [Flavobacteriaceae bacterium]